MPICISTRTAHSVAAESVDHMATADVARDLDVLRRPSGTPKLNYAGVSYGTFLGQTYANMFRRTYGR